MHRRSFIATCTLIAALVFALSSLTFAQSASKRGRKYKAPPPTSRIEVTVVKDGNGKPIENAAVVFHTLNESGNMELKSNEDGKAVIDVLPIGDTMRLQIIAKGYQTYGGDYHIDDSAMTIEIRMKRPGEEYSIYKAHPAENQKKEQSTVSAGDDKEQPKEKPQE